MNKLFFYILFLMSGAVSSQTERDAVALADELNIAVDSTIEPVHFRENFQRDYTSEEFQYQPLVKDTSRWDTFKAWLQYWLDRIFSFGDGEGNVTFFEYSIKILALLIVLFVVYLIVKAIINKEGGWIFGKSSQKKISTSEHNEEDFHNIDFRNSIEKSKMANNHRLSIRYYYLWLLKKMSDDGIIEWDIEKTNSDYLYEIQRSALKEDFQYLSYIYDYSWYGEFHIDDALFEKAEKAFVKALNSI